MDISHVQSGNFIRGSIAMLVNQGTLILRTSKNFIWLYIMLCLFHGLLQKIMLTDFAWGTVVAKEHQIVRKKRRRVSSEPRGVSDTYGAHCPHFQHVSRSAQRGEWVRSVVFGFRSEEDGTRKIGKVLRFLKMETKNHKRRWYSPEN